MQRNSSKSRGKKTYFLPKVRAKFGLNVSRYFFIFMSASTWWTVWFCWLWGCWFVFSRIMFNRLCIRIIRRTATGIILRRLFPTQNLLSDAECKICKYKWLITSMYASDYGGRILCRGTEEGRKICKNLQIWLPSKKENANICKIDFPVLCTFTLFNADFCTFLH